MDENVEKSSDETKETKEVEGVEEEKKEKGQVEAEREGGDSQTSIFLSPLRLVRKPKMKVVVCHVTLLDGTDFTCEVEVRLVKIRSRFKEC